SGRRWTAWRQLRFQGARGVVMDERSPPDRMEIPRTERAVALRPGGSVRGLVNAITNYLMQSLPDERARRHTHGPTSRVPARLPPICLLLRGFAHPRSTQRSPIGLPRLGNALAEFLPCPLPGRGCRAGVGARRGAALAQACAVAHGGRAVDSGHTGRDGRPAPVPRL